VTPSRKAAGSPAGGPQASRAQASRPQASRVQASRPQASRRQAAGRPGGGRQPARRPLPQGQALYTPGASAGRRAVERRSAALLVYLHQLPRWIPPVVLAALLITGLAVHGIMGGIALLVLALVLTWLAVVSWPSLSPAARAVRALVTAMVAVVAVIQIIR
jgi:hypothetical protein